MARRRGHHQLATIIEPASISIFAREYRGGVRALWWYHWPHAASMAAHHSSASVEWRSSASFIKKRDVRAGSDITQDAKNEAC